MRRSEAIGCAGLLLALCGVCWAQTAPPDPELAAKQAAAELDEKAAVYRELKQWYVDGMLALKRPNAFEALSSTGLRGISTGSDDCNLAGSAAGISGEGAFAFDLNGATDSAENQSDFGCSAFGSSLFHSDVWFCWTAPSTCDVTVSLCGQETVPPGPTFDPKVGVYGGCECPVAAGPIACSDDSVCGFRSELTFAATANQQYLIRIGVSGAAFSFTPGSGVMTITCAGGGGPGADDCSLATPVGEGSFTGDTTGFTGLNESSCGTNDDLDAWFAYTPSINGNATFSTCGSAFDTTLSIFNACGGTQLACNDTGAACGGDGGAAATLTVSASNTYYVRVAGVNSGSGAFNLDISIVEPPPGPANDFCADAEQISGDGTFSFDNVTATTDGPAHAATVTAGCTNAGQSNINSDVWYCWTATCSGLTNVSTCNGTTLDTKIAIYNTDANCSCPTGDAELVTCQDDASGCGLQTTVSFGATQGNHYLIRIGSFSTTVQGAGTFTVSPCIVPPANDECDAAEVVGEGSFPGTLTGSTGVDVDSCAGTDNARDVWFRYSPSMDGAATIDTCGTMVDTVIAVFSDCPSSGGTELAGACSDIGCATGGGDLLGLAVDDALDYLIRVSGDGGAAGDFTLNIAVQPLAPNDDCANATPVGEGSFPSTLAGSTGTDVDTCAGTDNTNDVWFQYAPSINGIATFSTCGTATDTVLAVFNGCPESGGTQLTGACSDAGCATGGGDSLQAVVSTASVYLVRVSGDAGATGDFTLSISVQPPTSNDLCGTAQPISGTGSFGFTTVGATTDSPAPNASCAPSGGGGAGSSMSNDVWFCWTSTCTGQVTVTIGGTATDLELAVFPTDVNCVCPTSSAGIIACDDDSGTVPAQPGELTPLLRFQAVNGVRYLFEVGHFSATAARTSGTVEVSCIPVDPVGACCFPNGSCANLTAANCATQGGTYEGDGTNCQSTSCPQPPPTGACCFGPTDCQIRTEAQCQAEGGAYIGDNATCGGAGSVTSYSSGTINLAIPDNVPAGVGSTITVTENRPIDSINFALFMRHTWIGDLIVTVTFTPADGSPPISADLFRRPNSTSSGGTGGVVGDSSNLGAGTTMFLYTFDDTAAQTIWTASLAGDSTYNIPAGPYRAVTNANAAVELDATFGNRSAQGTWRVSLSDNAGADTGVLGSWTVNVTEPAGDPPCANLAGACCIDRCTCVETNEEDCANQGGVFGGNGSSCGDATGCYPNPACPCDINGVDGLDSQDFFDFLDFFFVGDVLSDINCADGVDSQDYFDFVECFFGGVCQ